MGGRGAGEREGDGEEQSRGGSPSGDGRSERCEDHGNPSGQADRTVATTADCCPLSSRCRFKVWRTQKVGAGVSSNARKGEVDRFSGPLDSSRAAQAAVCKIAIARRVSPP